MPQCPEIARLKARNFLNCFTENLGADPELAREI
jgi:hypothetical protein